MLPRVNEVLLPQVAGIESFLLQLLKRANKVPVKVNGPGKLNMCIISAVRCYA